MSAIERMIDLADTSSKSDDQLVYQLNLLAHLLRTDEKSMGMINQIHRLLSLRNSFLPEVAKIFEEHAEGLMAGLMASASKNGWFMNTLTMHRVKFFGDSPEAKKAMNMTEEGLDKWT